MTADSVTQALSRVMAELPAIGKNQQASAQQGGYAYRGIEQITQHAQPLLAKHGVVFVPRVESWDRVEVVVNGKPWSDTIALVSYDVFGPGGTDDRITVGPILAIGRDNSDKGANKCMTQAFKYALLQTLCICDGKDDGDRANHEADERPTTPPPFNAKAHVLDLCGGDKGKAKDAWTGMGAQTSWSAAQLDEAFEDWINQPKGET